MLSTKREKLICEKYSAYDETGHVNCGKCPLQKGDPAHWDFRCKANSHYDRKTGEWEYDDIGGAEND